jgi:hypothetical protein
VVRFVPWPLCHEENISDTNRIHGTRAETLFWASWIQSTFSHRRRQCRECLLQCVGFQVITAVVIKPSVFCDITPCIPLKVDWCSRGTSRIHLQGWKVSQVRCRQVEESHVFLRIIDQLSADYIPLYPRRQNSSWCICSEHLSSRHISNYTVTEMYKTILYLFLYMGMKLGLAGCGRYMNCECLRTMCWEEYSSARKRK